jgi:hypothetical protein
MNASTEQKLGLLAQALGPLSRTAAVLMLTVVFVLAAMQDTARHTSVFQALSVFIFSMIGFVLASGLVVLAIGLSIKCQSCGRRATFVGPRNPKHPYPLTTPQRLASFFWPTEAYFKANRCSNCGHAFHQRSNGQSPNP